MPLNVKGVFCRLMSHNMAVWRISTGFYPTIQRPAKDPASPRTSGPVNGPYPLLAPGWWSEDRAEKDEI